MAHVRFISLVAFLLIPGWTFAHEMRPGFLSIRETAESTYDVMWKVPARGGNLRLSLNVEFADDVEFIGEPVAGFTGDAHVQRMRIRRDGGLTGTTVTISGLESTYTDALLRFEGLDGSLQTVRLSPDSPSYTVEASPGRWGIAWAYTVLGVEHILLGIDHLLFVLALLMIVSGWKKLIGTITAFTVAHSITLTLAALGVVNVPGPPVEAIIALSIVFVAAEIIRGRQGQPGLTEKAPWLVALTFGLLHGFGFAGALSEIGLPQQAIPMALFSFNLGVEAGQLLFVGVLVGLYSIAVRVRSTWPESVCQLPAYAIGGVAAFWVIERTAGF